MPRTSSFICVMLSTSSLNNFLFTGVLLPVLVELPKNLLLRGRQIVFHAPAIDPGSRREVNYSHATSLPTHLAKPAGVCVSEQLVLQVTLLLRRLSAEAAYYGSALTAPRRR